MNGREIDCLDEWRWKKKVSITRWKKFFHCWFFNFRRWIFFTCGFTSVLCQSKSILIFGKFDWIFFFSSDSDGSWFFHLTTAKILPKKSTNKRLNYLRTVRRKKKCYLKTLQVAKTSWKKRYHNSFVNISFKSLIVTHLARQSRLLKIVCW